MKKLFVVFLTLVMAMSACMMASAQRTDVNIITQVSPDSLDPMATNMLYAYQVLYNIYDGLMARDTSDNVIPGLAESYTANDDASEFVFQIRQGVKFQNGADLTTDDVVYSIERAVSMGVSNSAVIDKVEATGDYEVTVTLKQPYAPFLGVMTTPGFYILNREYTEAAGDSFGRNPMGTGPYKFVEWIEGENIELEAFDEYYRGAPEIKKATFKFIGDSNTALIAMESGDADYSYVFPESAKEEIEFNDDLKLYDYNSMALQFMTFNVTNPNLSNKLVRQAINYAANRDDMVIVAAEGNGRPTTQYCNIGTFGYIEGQEGYTYDVEKAKELMAEAGLSDGFTVRIIAQDDMTSKEAQILADNLRDININVEIEMQESNTAVANFMAGNYEIGVLGIGNSMLDYDSQKRLFTPGNSLNLSQDTSEAMDEIFELFDLASQLGDPDARLEVYREVNEKIWEEAPYLPIYFPFRSHLLAADLDIECVRGIGVAHVYEMHWN